MKKVTYLYLIYLLLPIVLLFVGSLGQSWTNSLLPTGFTTQWYLEIWESTAYKRALITSLMVCVVVCILNFIMITPLIYRLHISENQRLQKIVRTFALLPIAVPELILAFGFILFFSQEITPWLGTTWLLILGHWVITCPYFYFSVTAEISRSPLTVLDQVAQSFGANQFTRFKTVFLPLAAKSIFSALVTVAAISLGEFQLSNFIAGFLNRTYPTLLLQAFYGATGLACAATVILLCMAICMSLLSNWQPWNKRKGF
ncbi:ABC transporter permease subunit [Acinetobacter sp. B5B]|uniref:ABC transporter permease n=1 Tax=Acinetobacter baretiae TaxID=2605383 RepID=UPI0018C25C2F|nr:ABC transporter permease subunit [Acinetobacter baretiae]MBF7683172.1 ABC transporter permease subunit [Acinetobacter baretiae]MBF7684568.1 ABC transporter permease subunit [Acinetobacter baretiae]